MELLQAAEVASYPKQVPACACPTEGVIELVAKRWTLCILATLSQRPALRFNRLQDELPGISPKTLSDTLAALQAHDIVTRTAFAEVPPRVEYALAPRGRALVVAIAPLMDWAAAHGKRAPCCN
jgi:DNA-binding HxlR family transcriptional regulator